MAEALALWGEWVGFADSAELVGIVNLIDRSSMKLTIRLTIPIGTAPAKRKQVPTPKTRICLILTGVTA